LIVLLVKYSYQCWQQFLLLKTPNFCQPPQVSGQKSTL
jgi:hypothetical protein